MAQNIFQMSGQYEEYLVDESKYSGYADSISFPKTEEELIDILKALKSEGTVVTIQGGKTGIVGGAVPNGGHVLNLSHMNHVKEFFVEADGTGRITVEPGINLMELRKEIDNFSRKNPLFLPVDPTETSASIGGIVASGAQGISRVLYGSSRQYIAAVRLVDENGTVRKFDSNEMVTLSNGKRICGLDTVFGKEGITGVISEVTLKLIPKPESVWGIVFFFGEKEEAAAFVDCLKKNLPRNETAAVVSVEYIDRKSLDMIEARKSAMSKIKELPDIEQEIKSVIYLELHGEEDGIEELAEILMELAMECGSDTEAAWAVSGESEVEKLHAFRHAAAETMNLFVEERHRQDERITKLGMDLLIGNVSFGKLLESYELDMEQAGLTGCVFGHALDNHLHVNILPESYEQYEKGIELSRVWAKRAGEAGGKIIGEHGVGKLKQKILGESVPKAYVEECKVLKESMGETTMLNQGNIFGRQV